MYNKYTYKYVSVQCIKFQHATNYFAGMQFGFNADGGTHGICAVARCKGQDKDAVNGKELRGTAARPTEVLGGSEQVTSAGSKFANGYRTSAALKQADNAPARGFNDQEIRLQTGCRNAVQSAGTFRTTTAQILEPCGANNSERVSKVRKVTERERANGVVPMLKTAVEAGYLSVISPPRPYLRLLI